MMNYGRQRLLRLTAVQQMQLFVAENVDYERFVVSGDFGSPDVRVPYDPAFLQAWQKGFPD